MYAATGSSSLRSWGYRHPNAVTGVRIAAGTWNLVLGIFFLAHGQRWAWVLFAVSVAIFSAAFILARGKSGSRRSSQN
jgi:hypothetical protein